MPELILDRIHRWLKPGALVLSDQELSLEPAWQLNRVDTTGQVEHSERCFVYRRRRA
jgi:hypothetical protein